MKRSIVDLFTSIHNNIFVYQEMKITGFHNVHDDGGERTFHRLLYELRMELRRESLPVVLKIVLLFHKQDKVFEMRARWTDH